VRFRNSIKLAPGLPMNLSGSGLSWTVGPRGASVGFGRRGAYLNSGIPGTGLYSRTRLDSPAAHGSAPKPNDLVKATVRVNIGEDGVMSITHADGQPLPTSVIEEVKL
jgi:hypothetical protein